MTGRIKTTILRFESIDSTNLEAMRQAKAGCAEGVCVIAREQTHGRGRLQRSWESPKDAGLYLSIVLRPRIELGDWPLITLMGALSVSDALMKACGLRTDIKWPNDVCVGDLKLCGILAETIETESGMAAILGIGINLKEGTLSPEVSAQATSIQTETGSSPELDLLLRELINAIAERYDSLQSDGGAEHTVREWCANSSYAFDRRVRVSTGGETFEGMTRGLEGDGALRVETGDGEIRIVRAGEVAALRVA